MLASNAAGDQKWEHAVVSCMDSHDKIWARVKVRCNREYSVVKTDAIEQCYGSLYFKIKRKLTQ